MNRNDGFHPARDRLRAFSLGRLSDVDSAAIEAHIADCPRCCEALAGLSGPDAFQAKLRDVGLGVAGEGPVPSSPTILGSGAQAPRELCSHPRYQVLGVLGSGGMGTVFKATHRLLDRPVVVKAIHPELVHNFELVERFQREARLAASLSHPNIVTVYEAEQIGPTYLLVMEFINGESLAELVRKRGPLPQPVACELARQAAVGLQHLHKQRLVHRDIKPANLMATPGGVVKVLDLGLAFLKANAAKQRELTLPQQSMGTIDYMAPEQWADSHEVDIRADISSLGCTNAIIRDQAAALGGQVVGEEYLRLGSQDVAGMVKKIATARPDVILNTINGDTNLAFFRALRAAGITAEKAPTISFSIAEEDLTNLNARDVVGDPGGRRCHPPGHWGPELRCPQGPVRIDPATQHTFKTVRIGKIVEGRRFEVVYTSEKPIEPVPYPSTREQKEWDEFLHDLHLRWGGRWDNPGEAK